MLDDALLILQCLFYAVVPIPAIVFQRLAFQQNGLIICLLTQIIMLIYPV